MATEFTSRPVAASQPVNPWSQRDNPRDAITARLISIDGKPLPAPTPDKPGDPLKARLIELRNTHEALVDINGKPYLVRSRTPFPNSGTLNLKFLAPDDPDPPTTQTKENNKQDPSQAQTGKQGLGQSASQPNTTGTNALGQTRLNQTESSQNTKDVKTTTQLGQRIEDLNINKNDAKIQVSGTARLLAKIADQNPQASISTLKIPNLSKELIFAPSRIAEHIKQNLEQSGLFYESHIKAWAQNRYSLNLLNQEPQAKQSLLNETGNTKQAHNSPSESADTKNTTQDKSFPTQATTPSVQSDRSLTKALTELIKNQQVIQFERQDNVDTKPQLSNLETALQNIPSSLRPLIQDQIHLLEQGKIILAGQINDQHYEFTIDPEDDAREQTRPGVLAKSWRVNMKLHTQNLGILTVRLRLTGNETHLKIHTDTEHANLHANTSQQLAHSLEAHGLKLSEFTIHHNHEPRSSTEP